MGKIKSIEGVSSVVNLLEKENILVSFKSKSEAYRIAVKSKEEMIALYKDLLLNGSKSSILLKTCVDRIAMENDNPEYVKLLKEQFQNEIKKDMEILTKKAKIIKTNRNLPERNYHNEKTIVDMCKDFVSFTKNENFYALLTPAQKLQIEKFLNILEIKEGTIQDRQDFKDIQAINAIKNTYVPILEKFTQNKNLDTYKFALSYASRIANMQINIAPIKFDEYRTLNIDSNEVQKFYDIIKFMKDFYVKGYFDPEKQLEKNEEVKIQKYDNASKTKKLTQNDIKLIFSNAKKFNRPDLQIDFIRPKDAIHAEVADRNLKQQIKKDFNVEVDYNQFLVNIKRALDDVQNGMKIEKIKPSLRPYVEFLQENCPNVDYMANLSLADCTEVTVAASKNVQELEEPLLTIPRFLVDDARFTPKDIKNLLNATITNMGVDANIATDCRLDIVARVLNRELDLKFLTNDEVKLLSYLNLYFNSLDDKEKLKYLTSKENYVDGENLLLSANDMKILFESLTGNFQSFKITRDDFKITVDGTKGKMLEQFGCTYDMFFERLREKYIEYVSYGSTEITSASDPYFRYVKFLISYCKDITYAPSVELTTSKNADEPLYLDDSKNDFPYTTSKKYVNIVMNLPSVAKAMKSGSLHSWNYSKKLKYLGIINELNAEKKMLNVRRQKLESKIDKLKIGANYDAINYFSQELRITEHKIAQVELKINMLSEKLDYLAQVEKIIKGQSREFEFDDLGFESAMVDEVEETPVMPEDIRRQEVDISEEFELDEIDEELDAEYSNFVASSQKPEFELEEIEEEVELDEIVEQKNKKKVNEFENEEEFAFTKKYENK